MQRVGDLIWEYHISYPLLQQSEELAPFVTPSCGVFWKQKHRKHCGCQKCLIILFQQFPLDQSSPRWEARGVSKGLRHKTFISPSCPDNFLWNFSLFFFFISSYLNLFQGFFLWLESFLSIKNSLIIIQLWKGYSCPNANINATYKHIYYFGSFIFMFKLQWHKLVLN